MARRGRALVAPRSRSTLLRAVEVVEALALEGGNGARAAKRRAVHRNDVYKAMRKYGIKKQKGDGEE